MTLCTLFIYVLFLANQEKYGICFGYYCDGENRVSSGGAVDELITKPV